MCLFYHCFAIHSNHLHCKHGNILCAISTPVLLTTCLHCKHGIILCAISTPLLLYTCLHCQQGSIHFKLVSEFLDFYILSHGHLRTNHTFKIILQFETQVTKSQVCSAQQLKIVFLQCLWLTATKAF